ncbi:MAG: lamin tail domain-containing protein [Bacteroidaceae bacterium]|nr:lamin tail domain-containing protein [Bacteroidaceae bacterium]
MKRFSCILLFAVCTAASAQEWIDITSQYIEDPAYSRGNYDEWDYWGWASSTATRAGTQEFWNGTWDFSKTVEVPAAGQYRIRVQGYYRPGDFSNEGVAAYQNGTEQIGCYLYANDDAVPMASVYEASSDHSLGDCWPYVYRDNAGTRVRIYYPNSMETGAAMFSMGHYQNELQTTVGSDKQLTFGIRLDWDAFVNSNWVLFTNWQLEWYGQEVQVTNISLSQKAITMAVGEQTTLEGSVWPANATFKKLQFESSDESVATVDAETGVITAVRPGTATITVTMAIGNSTAKATCQVTVEKSQVKVGDLLVNEVQQANVDMYIDPSFNFGGWIELYNATDNSVSLNGLYISDDPRNLLKMPLDSRFGAVPAHGFHNIWFGHHSWWTPKTVNFKLDCDGGTIYLSDATGHIIIEQSYPAAIARTSYARKTDGGNEWGYTDQPTPAATNATSAFAQTRLEAPRFDREGGFFTGRFSTQVKNIPSGAILRYTTDGSTPTLTNGQTSTNGIFESQETTILRVRFFQEGMLSSPVVTRSFIKKTRDFTLPAISLVSDERNLTGADYGIFVQGNGNGRPGNGQAGNCNWNMDWDRPANIEFITPEKGVTEFNQEVGIESSGGWSRAWSPHSFNIKANKIYEGVNHMDYQFFPNKAFLRHKGLKVRNGGNDTSQRIKDGAVQEVVRTSGLYVETQSFQPVHIYQNGRYIGVLNLREPNNKNYAYANYGIGTDDDEIDQWKMSPDSGYVQQVGTKDVFNEWYSLAENAADALAYERIKQIVDIEEICNYLAVQFYLAGNDYPKNNIKSFRERSEGQSNSRFRAILFDLAFAFAQSNGFTWFFDNSQYWTYDRLYGAQVIAKYGTDRLYGEIEFVTIIKNMLQNAEFKKQLVDQCCIVTGSVFEPTRAREVVTELINRMAADGHNASSSGNSIINNITTSRQNSTYNNMRSYFGLSNPLTVNLSANIEEAGLLINGLNVPTGKFAGKLFAPVTVSAAAPAGYRFAGWRSSMSSKVTEMFGKGTTWSYYDQGSLDEEDWKSTSYDASDWQTGAAPLGYFVTDGNNSRGYQTFLEYGGNNSNKYPTYYFRKEITLKNANATAFTLDWVADDGFVIYVNGQEAGRYLMPSGQPSFNTFATTYAQGNPDSGTMTLNSRLFHTGRNVIAVELHNNAANSTDVLWDAALSMEEESDADFASQEPDYELPSAGNMTLVAMFEPLTAEELAATDAHPVKINEVSAGNDLYVNDYFKRNDWIELYNTTEEDIDVAGMYLSDKLENPLKYQIPASDAVSTVIPAHGHLVIWTDKLENLTQLHADFKLNNEDSCCVLLTAADESWSDTLSYCRHNGYQSVGLYPDGGSQLYVMDRPTIGQANMLTTTAQLWQEPKDFTDGVTPLQQNKQESGIIYDLSGRQIVNGKSVNGKLPRGIYIINGKKIIKD